MRGGDATDVTLAAGSSAASAGNSATNGNLQILYAAFRGEGVYYTTAATNALSLVKTSTLATQQGNGQFVDDKGNIVPIAAPLGTQP